MVKHLAVKQEEPGSIPVLPSLFSPMAWGGRKTENLAIFVGSNTEPISMRKKIKTTIVIEKTSLHYMCHFCIDGKQLTNSNCLKLGI